ncbi:MAG: aminotransferase class V-fold PLP-dependent enzyme [Calditrichaeota bacterium]|nr:aminotransferase class V-fold PLP-dependent enzyme [Calditrichota bacterium]
MHSSSQVRIDDWSPEEFQQHAERALHWVTSYLENLRSYPVLSRAAPGEVKAQLPVSPPEEPQPFAEILADFERVVLPGITHWNHPRFFAYFSITGSCPGILGELIASALNVNAMLWKTSPAATELEQVVLDWLRQMVGLPQDFRGVINDTASVSSLCAMAAAREAAGLAIREQGLSGRSDLPRLCMYTSDQAHSSIEKAAIVLGIGQQWLRKIPCDAQYRMDVRALEQVIRADEAAGCRPLCVVATIGTTSTTSVDPVAAIAELCAEHGLWLHVDAAYGGAAAIVPEKRPLFAGWERADSIVVNPHKWLFTPIDCSVLFCRRPEVLRQAFSLTPEYLRTAEQDQVTNLMDYGVSLGRRFRALKLWMVIRSLGTAGIAQALRQHMAYAERLAELISAHSDFELVAPVPFSTVVFRYRPRGVPQEHVNALNERLLAAVNGTGKAMLSHTVLRGTYALRLAIGNLRTTWEDVELAWQVVQEEAERVGRK